MASAKSRPKAGGDRERSPAPASRLDRSGGPRRDDRGRHPARVLRADRRPFGLGQDGAVEPVHPRRGRAGRERDRRHLREAAQRLPADHAAWGRIREAGSREKGRAIERRIEHENEVRVVEASLRALHASANNEDKVSPDNVLRAYVVFLVLVGMAATFALGGLTIAFRAIDGLPFVWPWAWIPVGLALAVFITLPLVSMTIGVWVARTQADRSNWWQARLFRGIFVSFVSIDLISVLSTSRSVALYVILTAVFLITFVIPALCLFLSRDRPRGPAEFAYWRLIDIAERNRSRAVAEDARAPV